MTDIAQPINSTEATQPASTASSTGDNGAAGVRKHRLERVDLVLCGHDGCRNAVHPDLGLCALHRGPSTGPRPTDVDGTPLSPEATASTSTTIPGARPGVRLEGTPAQMIDQTLGFLQGQHASPTTHPHKNDVEPVRSCREDDVAANA